MTSGPAQHAESLAAPLTAATATVAGQWTQTHNIHTGVNRSHTHTRADSRWPVTAKAHVRSQSSLYGICGGCHDYRRCHPVLLFFPVSILPTNFPKCAPTSSRGSVDTFLNFLFEVYLFFNYRYNILLTIIAELYLAMCLFRVTVRNPLCPRSE